MSSNQLKFNLLRRILFTAFGIGSCYFLSGCSSNIKDKAILSSETDLLIIESVAALGQLSPLGEIRKLAPPINNMGSSPRILEVLVDEGQIVRKGQDLVVFDNQQKLNTKLEKLSSKINLINSKISIKEKEISRISSASTTGAASLIDIDRKKLELIELLDLRNNVEFDLKINDIERKNSILKSPIDGVVLKIISYSGERAQNGGVIEIGASHLMEAVIEVYESDINRVFIGQKVSLTSENGGFEGSLIGNVYKISPQVEQRKVLSTDPTGDADARIVNVRVSLDMNSRNLVKNLSGMKVIARFAPN